MAFSLKASLRRIEQNFKLLRRLGGVHPRECSNCGYRGRFRAYGIQPRFDALCPSCGSVERHRLLVLGLAGLGPLPQPIVHFAAEDCLRDRLRGRYADYRTADISGRAELTLDIEAMNLPDASVGTVICLHVLEHVNDAKALAELRRVLRPDGMLLAMVPIVEAWAETYEDPALVTPAARKLHYGQGNHVRQYGRDFRDRVARAGFAVREFVADGPMSARYGLIPGETLFICRPA